jgi:hypothetical protein
LKGFELIYRFKMRILMFNHRRVLDVVCNLVYLVLGFRANLSDGREDTVLGGQHFSSYPAVFTDLNGALSRLSSHYAQLILLQFLKVRLSCSHGFLYFLSFSRSLKPSLFILYRHLLMNGVILVLETLLKNCFCCAGLRRFEANCLQWLLYHY